MLFEDIFWAFRVGGVVVFAVAAVSVAALGVAVFAVAVFAVARGCTPRWGITPFQGLSGLDWLIGLKFIFGYYAPSALPAISPEGARYTSDGCSPSNRTNGRDTLTMGAAHRT